MLKNITKKYKRKIIDEVYRRRFGRFESSVTQKMISDLKTNSLIADMLKSDKPFLVGRLGWIECQICWNFTRASFFNKGHSHTIAKSASNNAGISSLGDKSFDRFSTIYLSAIPFADLIGAWEVKGMFPLLHTFGSPALQYTTLPALDPWHAFLAGELAWTLSLEGKSVLVVHPFAQSIQKQYARRTEIKSIKDMMPEFELSTLIPPVTFAGQDNGKTWVANLQSLTSEVAGVKFDVAIVGCGAYGLPLAAFIKQMGRQAIHLGGATQLLFGIRGNRWDSREYSSVMDESWVRPQQDERPKGAATVEDACYW